PDAVETVVLLLGHHLYVNGGVLDEVVGCPSQYDDAVGVPATRLGRVVAPLERLDRMLAQRMVGTAGRMGGEQGEGLYGPHQLGLTLHVIMATDGEPEHIGTVEAVEVEAQQDGVCPRDRLDREPTGLLAPPHDPILPRPDRSDARTAGSVGPPALRAPD